MGVLLLSLSHIFGDVFDWRAIVIVESIALAFNSRFVGENSTVSSQTRIGHVNVVIELNNLLDSSALLKLCHCFFLNDGLSTSTARMTDEELTRPTAQSPFLTASMAYSTWKRWPFGEKTVMAVSYI